MLFYPFHQFTLKMSLAGREREREMDQEAAYAQVYKLATGSLACLATRTACELGIPNILLAHEGTPLSATQICQRLQPPPSHAGAAISVERLMRFLCAHGIFKSESGQDALYSITQLSRLLAKQPHGADEAGASCKIESASMPGDAAAHDHNTNIDGDGANACASRPTGSSMANLLYLMPSEEFLPPWQQMGQFILQGGDAPFFRAHGMDIWPFLKSHPKFNHVFNAAMTCDAQLYMEILFKHYDGFKDVRSVVDVGGGVGMVASQIASQYPSIKVVNFDLRQVLAMAPNSPGVQHISGNMFEHAPKGDVFFFKRFLYAYGYDDCIKILQNCWKVLPEHGKVIIMDVVLDITAKESNSLNEIRLALDMIVMANTSTGKQRTMEEWKCLLEDANFHKFRFIDLPSPLCVIEAFPTPQMTTT